MTQDSPVAAHLEVERTLIAARPYLLGVAKNRGHPRVRHIAFERDTRSNYPATAGALQGHCERIEADPWWIWIALITENNIVRYARRTGTTEHLQIRQSQQNGEKHSKSAVLNHDKSSTFVQLGRDPA